MGPIRTGFSSLGTHSVETAFERGAAYGFDFVELTMNDYDRGLLADEAAAIRSLAADADLDVVVHLPFGRDDLAVGSSDDDARATSLAALKACVRAAGDVGAEKGVLHVEASSDAPHLLETDGLAELVTTLVELDGFARERGVELCAENMLRRPPRLSDLAVLLDRTDLSLTLDTGHARANGRDHGAVAAFVEEHAADISHVHLNDTRGPSDEHRPFGAGDYDFAGLFDAFPDDWAGTLSLEVSTEDYEYIGISKRKLDELL
jgi:sugar phosphate isomerase/epimerase